MTPHTGSRTTRSSRHPLDLDVAEHLMVNPLQMKDNVEERRGRKRETQGLGEHITHGGVS